MWWQDLNLDEISKNDINTISCIGENTTMLIKLENFGWKQKHKYVDATFLLITLIVYVL